MVSPRPDPPTRALRQSVILTLLLSARDVFLLLYLLDRPIRLISYALQQSLFLYHLSGA